MWSLLIGLDENSPGNQSVPTDLSSFLERAGHFNREESEFLSNLRIFHGYVLAKNVAPTVLVSMISPFVDEVRAKVDVNGWVKKHLNVILPCALKDALCVLDRAMELLNGPEFRDMRIICQETMTVFGNLFIEAAKSEIFVTAVENHSKELAKTLKPFSLPVPERLGRNIAPSRLNTSIPPHIHDDNHTYDQDPASKLSATIVGWREVKALTHYGVYVVEVICSDGRPPKWIYKRYREFERLFSHYGKLVSAATKVRMPSTSSSSPVINKDSSGSSSPTGSTKSRSKSSNKFDPSFHEQRAKGLQPLLTGLCERSDVFGLTKFMRWLFFEKKSNISLLGIFQQALQKTLDFYDISTPIYANNMIDALTWLMYVRISHIWLKLRKGIHFMAVRAVQEVILKAIRPLDDLIMQINTMSVHIHEVLTKSPWMLLKPKSLADRTLVEAFHKTFAAYELPIQSMLGVVSNEFSGSLQLIGAALSSKFETLTKLAYKNIFNDGDELSVTALVTETDGLFEVCQLELLPALQEAVSSLHTTLNDKFTSPAMQDSFMALAVIGPILLRLLDGLLPQQAVLDLFLRILKMRHAVEALELSLDAQNLRDLLNELETEAEREIEKVQISLSLKARMLHASIRRLHAACFPLAAPIGEAMLQFANMWGTYMRKFTRLASDLISAQQRCLIPISWSVSVRECLVFALQRANDWLVHKSRKLACKLLHTTFVALFEPLTLTISSLLSEQHVVDGVTQIFDTHLITPPQTPPPTSALIAEVPLSDSVDPASYIQLKAEKLISDAVGRSLERNVIEPLFQAWIETQVSSIPDEDDKAQRERLYLFHQRLLSELQKQEMDDEMMHDSLYEDRRLTIAGVMMSSLKLPEQTSPKASPVDSVLMQESARKLSTSSTQPISYSESPVARLMGRLTIESESIESLSVDIIDKKLSRDLPMLSRISEQGGAKVNDEYDFSLVTDTPALIFNFDVNEGQKRETVTASGVWAAAEATQALYRGGTQTRRVFYEVHDGNGPEVFNRSETKSPPANRPPGYPGSSSDPNSTVPSNPPLSAVDARIVPKKPILGNRPTRGSSASPQPNHPPISVNTSTSTSTILLTSPTGTPSRQRGSFITTGLSTSSRESSPSPYQNWSQTSTLTGETSVSVDSTKTMGNDERPRWTASARPSQIYSVAETKLDNSSIISSSPPAEQTRTSPSPPTCVVPASPSSTSPIPSPSETGISTSPTVRPTPQFTVPGASIRIKPRPKQS